MSGDYNPDENPPRQSRAHILFFESCLKLVDDLADGRYNLFQGDSKADTARASRKCRECRVGPRNFAPSLSQIPDVILSHHPARAIARRLPPSAETSGSSRFDPVGPTQRR